MKSTAWLLLLLLATTPLAAQQRDAHEHSPNAALRWSIIPGGGQIYNHQAWKIPIIYGALAGVGYFAYDNYQTMKLFKDEYLFRQQNDGATRLADYAAYPTSSIYRLYNSYNQQFQLLVIICAGIYALNLIDAYVFGHLFDFQLTNDLAFVPGIIASPLGVQPSVGLQLNL